MSWWMDPYRRRDEMAPYFGPSMADRYFRGFFDEMMKEMERPFRGIANYWMNQPSSLQCNIGNAVGKVVDDKGKFAVEVDVSQFRPEELSVNVRDRELVLEGHHEERADDHGSIERHFVRKYHLPDDVQLDSIVSHLSDKGVLSVAASKHAIETPPARKIPIQAAPREQPKQEQKE